MNRGTYDGISKDNRVLYTRWDQDCPPANPHSLNDEFENGRFSGNWTKFDQNGNLTITPIIEGMKGIQMVQATTGGHQVAGLYTTIPSGDFTVISKVSCSYPLDSGGNFAGIALWQDGTASTGDIYTYSFLSPATSTVLRIMVSRFNQWNSYGSDVQIEADDWGLPSAYFRLRRTSTTYSFDISQGEGWLQIRSNTITFTPTHFGLFVDNNGSGIDLKGNFEFWRYLPYDVGVGGFHLGKHINVYE